MFRLIDFFQNEKKCGKIGCNEMSGTIVSTQILGCLESSQVKFLLSSPLIESTYCDGFGKCLIVHKIRLTQIKANVIPPPFEKIRQPYLGHFVWVETNLEHKVLAYP